MGNYDGVSFTIELLINLFGLMHNLNQLPNGMKLMNLEHNANFMALK
jgi:hypothetical protein